jgi:hypothetical protein
MISLVWNHREDSAEGEGNGVERGRRLEPRRNEEAHIGT